MNRIERVQLEQNTPEWLEFRKNHIGASDAPAIMQKSPWTTPYQLWQQKLGLIGGPEDNEAMQRGREREPQARNEFNRITGFFVNPVVVKNRDYPFMCASMDGLSECGEHAVEIKIPGRQDHEIAMDGCIPEKYVPQLMHQMIVCDLKSIYYFSWNESSSKIIELSRDSQQEKVLLDREKQFWDCLENLKPPELVERDYETRTDAIFLEYESHYLEAKKARKIAEEKEKVYREHLIELSGDKCCKGKELRMTKYIVPGRIDYAEIPELKSINLEKYRKANTIAWRIS